VPSAAGGAGSGGVFDGDAVAEGLQPGDEALGFAAGVGAAVEVVGAEVVIGFAGGTGLPSSLSGEARRLVQD
jgi:hypothetical protein